MRTLCAVSVSLLVLNGLTPRSMQAQGHTFYVSSVSGGDTASGLTPQTAWKTLTKVNATKFSSGDVVLFRKGQIWEGTLRPSTKGITFSTYGDGPKPVITSKGVAGANNTVVLTVDWVTFDSLDFQGGLLSEIEFDGASHVTFLNCNIGLYCSNQGIFANSVGIAKTNDSCSVSGCFLNSGASTFYADHAKAQSGPSDAIWLRNGASGWDISNNVLIGWWHSGVEIYSDDSTKHSSGHNVHNNKFYGGGLSYCRGFAIVGRYPGCAKGNIVAFNYIQDMTVANQIGGDTNFVVGNVIKTVRDTLGLGSATGLSLESDFSSHGLCRGNKVWYNKIDGAQTSGIQVTDFGQCYDTLVAGNEITGNVVVNSGQFDFAIPSMQGCVARNIVLDNTLSSFRGVNNIIYRGNIIGVAMLNARTDMGDSCQRNH